MVLLMRYLIILLLLASCTSTKKSLHIEKLLKDSTTSISKDSVRKTTYDSSVNSETNITWYKETITDYARDTTVKDSVVYYPIKVTEIDKGKANIKQLASMQKVDSGAYHSNEKTTVHTELKTKNKAVEKHKPYWIIYLIIAAIIAIIGYRKLNAYT